MTLNQASGWSRLAVLGASALALGGCASTGAADPRDPLESYNRAMFTFNDKVDQVALKPAATVYKKVTPSFVQTGVGNFFGNLGDVWTGANNLLQGKGQAGMTDLTRVALNSTFGLLGLLDIASEVGLPKHDEDFGQTLGRYGVPSGPYLVLPLLGPSTLRDTAGLPVDIVGDPWHYKEPARARNAGTAVDLLDKRARLLDATNLLEDAALDRYTFVRDTWLQSRESKVYDGDPPRKRDADEDTPSNAASIKSAYEDDPGPTPEAPTAAGSSSAGGTVGSGSAPAQGTLQDKSQPTPAEQAPVKPKE